MRAREEILRLMCRYGFTIDSGDLDGFASLFEQGRWIAESHPAKVGKQAVLDALSHIILYEDGTPRTKHVAANIDIDIDEAGQAASAQSYVTVLQQTRDFPLQVIMCGHYFDRFECVEGKWRFAERAIRNVLVGDVRAHLKRSFEEIP